MKLPSPQRFSLWAFVYGDDTRHRCTICTIGQA
jgi:hypothetical protein